MTVIAENRLGRCGKSKLTTAQPVEGRTTGFHRGEQCLKRNISTLFKLSLHPV